MTKRKRGKKPADFAANAELPAVVDGLFVRVREILDHARGSVVRTVNSEMVLAYWHIGREIVDQVQRGESRAEYGRQVLEALSQRLVRHYGKGFSVTNLKYLRLFYQTYADRTPEIRHKPCDESGSVRTARRKRRKGREVLNDLSLAIERSDQVRGFSGSLSWSHYRTLTKVENRAERIERPNPAGPRAPRLHLPSPDARNIPPIFWEFA